MYEEPATADAATAIAFNWRPVQPLSGRVVQRSFPAVDQPSSPVDNQPSNPKPLAPGPSVIRSRSEGCILRIGTSDVFVLAGFVSWKLMKR